jgi:uncharacterized protein GlcG (DUF336 family)
MRAVSLGVIASLLLASCGGGGGGSGGSPTPSPSPAPTPSPTPASVYEVPAQVALLPGEVEQIIAQGVHEARARDKPASFVVVDRVGNVLAVFVMIGADLTLRVPAPAQGSFDLQGMSFPAPAAVAGAIAKAITGAYLSSSGNAFSTRTASMIVQEHFPPSAIARGLESGPLFGVQFSQLPCSDLSARFDSAAGPTAFIGPKRSPLGLSADAGGLPLYKNGIVVGGIGVMADGVYGFDPEIQDVDREDEEIIALAAATGYTPPDGIRADRITVDGTSLRYLDATTADVASNPAQAPSFASINRSVGNLISVAGYYDSARGVMGGRAYGSEASGIRASTPAEFSNRDAFILTDGNGANRYPVRGGTDAGLVPQPISQAEARALLEEAFLIMSRARAQIRRPLDSRAQVTISLVDTSGAVLGIVRAPDAPIFGTDVSLQKARTAAFFSHPQAAAQLDANPSADVRAMMAAARTFFGDNSAFTGNFAFTNRAIGNIARPFFPDGEVGRGPGPFSRPIASFNPFSTGLQSALIVGNVLEHVNFLFGRNPDVPQRCTATPEVTPGRNRIQNGIQIFPGSVPIYRGEQLIGGLGISGDGIDQDDMVSFLGLFNAGQRVGGIGHRDPARRSDQIVVNVGDGVRLRYVGCPFAPFVGSTEQNVCQGK